MAYYEEPSLRRGEEGFKPRRRGGGAERPSALAGNGRKIRDKPQRSMGLFDHTLESGFHPHQPTSTITNLAAATAPSAKLNAVARERRLGPCERQLKQEPLFFLGLGLGGPKQGLFGILPELIGF